MLRYILAICVLLLVCPTFAQDDQIIISGTYKNVSFIDFLKDIEKKEQVRFYYKKEWLENLTINFEGNISLLEYLEEYLRKNNLNCFLEGKDQIIIYKGNKIVENIPLYKTRSQQTSEMAKSKSQQDVKEKYIQRREIKELELITVGTRQSSNAGATHVVNGKITDIQTGEPLIGATVYIEEAEVGVVTDLDGFFTLPIKSGKYLVEASSLSMRSRKFYLQVYSGGMISVPLEKELMSITEVKIVADQHDNVKGLQMGYERISSKTMKEIPAVLGEKDLLRVAQMLPGVTNSGEGSSGLNVRGGTADQNLFYLNKIPVYNTSHLFGFFTAFSPDIVNSFSLYKSNIPAKYGGRISSIFDVSTRQGNKKHFYGLGGISPVTGHIAVEGPIIKDKTSFVASYRGTYSDWLLSKMDDINLQNSNAKFYDVSTMINSEIDKNNLVKFFAYGSNDVFSLATTDDYGYSNLGGALNWKHFFNSPLSVDVSLIFSQYKFEHTNKNNISEAYNQDYQLDHTEFRSDFLYVTKNNHRLSFGVSSILYQLDQGMIEPYGAESRRIPIDLGEEKGIENSFYFSDEFTITPRLNVSLGLRFGHFAYLGPAEINTYFEGAPIERENIKEVISFENNEVIKQYSSVEPRFAFNYTLGLSNSLKVSYNRGKQYIFMMSNTLAISPTDQWKLTDYYIKPPTSDQVSIGYYHDFREQGFVTSLELYRKWTDNIVEYKDGADFISPDPPEMMLLQGKQNSFGAEFMFKKNTGRLTGWTSYTYSRSIIQVSGSTPAEEINQGKKYPSNFDRPHTFNLVSNIRYSRKVSLSANVVYSSGRPITYPIASYYVEGQEVLYYSDRNKYRIPHYFRIDASVNIEGNLKEDKRIHSYWMVGVYNLTGRKNAYSVYFESENGKMQGYKLSIFGQPIFTVSWNFKFGNYASE